MPASGAPAEPTSMLGVADVREQDLTPWMQRRLQLAVEIAGELQADARRAVGVERSQG